jgi:uncharacterized membrane protein YgdD (TMEM256/DUF423 family)
MAGRGWMAAGAISAGIAVVCGAFAAHYLDKKLPQMYSGQVRVVAGEEMPASRKYLADFRTAAEYQIYHALGMLAVGLLLMKVASTAGNVAGWCFLLGTLLFSGSLYALVLTGITKLGMITPIGGVLFIVGWVALALAALKTVPAAKGL